MITIYRHSGIEPEYFTCDPAFTVGSSFAFNADKSKALAFGDKRSAEQFIKAFLAGIRCQVEDA